MRWLRPTEERSHEGGQTHWRVARRMRSMVEEQGFGLVLFVFGVVLLFVFIPVFIVDDMLYVKTVSPEVDARPRGGIRPRPTTPSALQRHAHNRTRAAVTAAERHRDYLRNATDATVGRYQMPDAAGAPNLSGAVCPRTTRAGDGQVDGQPMARRSAPAPAASSSCSSPGTALSLGVRGGRLMLPSSGLPSPGLPSPSPAREMTEQTEGTARKTLAWTLVAPARACTAPAPVSRGAPRGVSAAGAAARAAVGAAAGAER